MGFLFFPVMPMGLRWAALRAAGAPLLLLLLPCFVFNNLMTLWFIPHYPQSSHWFLTT